MPDRISRTHVVPGNIMSVEFKLFDLMTLKQFIYLVICAFLSYIFITILPDSIFKLLIPGVIMISGIIIAFVQFNGEPFEVYTTNFILGIIQPQRRVWSKTPIIKKVNMEVADTTASQKALKSVADNYVPEEEVIPIDYNKAVTDVDLQEQAFLKTGQVTASDTFAPTASIPKADLSKLNFTAVLEEDKKVEVTSMEAKPLIDLKDISQNPTVDVNIKTESNASSASPSVNLDLNNAQMNPNNPVTPNISSQAPAFVIDMEDDDQHSNSVSVPKPEDKKDTFVPLAQDLPQEQRAQNMPEINFDLTNSVSSVPPSTPASDIITGSLLDDLKDMHSDSPAVPEPMPAPQPGPVTPPNPIPVPTPAPSPSPVKPVIPEVPPVVVPVPSTKIHGRVLSAGGQPRMGLVVTMCDTEGKALEASITTSNGEFEFQTQPKSFQLKVFPPKRYLFSPMDKVTKEIVIHEDDGKGIPAVSSDLNSLDASTLEDAKEMNALDTQIANTVNGVVKDDQGHYLAGVLISIKDISGTTIRALASNPLGQFFSHSPLVNGKYSVHLEKDGYTFSSYTIELNGKVYNSKVYVAKPNIK